MAPPKTDQMVAAAAELSVRASLKGMRLVSKGLARGITRVLPQATTKAGAVGMGTAVGLGIDAVAAGVGALTGNPTGLGLGAIIGTGVGGMVGWAVAEQGMATASVSRGDLALGHQAGSLGLPKPVAMPRAARVRHVAVYGATGSGKSTVLRNLAYQDANASTRPGFLCIDIKDSLVTEIAANIPQHRLGDVLLFDPADTAFPPAFNPLAGVTDTTIAASELVAALKRLFIDSWGPRLEHVLRMVVLTLLETPDATLLDINRILTDAQYRGWAVPHVTNPAVQLFWVHEFPSIAGKGGSTTNVASILNKLSVFAYPEIRNVVGQTSRGLDLRAAMDQGKIVLANLPQGVLGEDASHFLAALLVGKAQLAAQSRVTLPEDQRRTFYVFADEFQNYETGAFTKLITEGRSMGVGVVAACQYRGQLVKELRDALDYNCAYGLQCRQVGGKHTVLVQKLQELDTPDGSVLLRALPPPPVGAQTQLAAIRGQSRRALAQPRATVEAAINQRLGLGTPPPPQPTVRVRVQQATVRATVHKAQPPPPNPAPPPTPTPRPRPVPRPAAQTPPTPPQPPQQPVQPPAPPAAAPLPQPPPVRTSRVVKKP